MLRADSKLRSFRGLLIYKNYWSRTNSTTAEAAAKIQRPLEDWTQAGPSARGNLICPVTIVAIQKEKQLTWLVERENSLEQK